MKLKEIVIFLSIFCFFLFGFLFLYRLNQKLINIYSSLESQVVRDRFGNKILIKPNKKGYFAEYLNEVPPRFKKLLLKKEDKYFYFHFGFNPKSIAEVFLSKLGMGKRKASSTISQQLVKILLGNEFERNLKNKIIESFYTLALEIFQSKEEILKMYVNSIYFGNKIQGLKSASENYFGLPPEILNDTQILQLLSTIQSPTETNPEKSKNQEIAIFLSKILKINASEFESKETIKKNIEKYSQFLDSSFEIQNFLMRTQKKEIQTTLDKELNKRIREIVKKNIDLLKEKNVKNGAAIVIKLPENEILALVGSPNPKSSEPGSQINMLEKPRPIGSTIKPFIYLKAFEKGLRPYTIVEDREYKYLTALGFPFYPKNFDYKYRGKVTLHYALSNSLNVPAVKVLEFVGFQDFCNFLERDFNFKPIQKWEKYQLGIGLGGLEMSLMDLAKFYTIFPNNGVLRELKIFKDEKNKEKKISEPQYIQLVNKILQDRKTGIEQFRLKSDLNLFQENYALKTGTSRDFQDSWIIGFTPDFLVGVWVGNHDATPMDNVSGQLGAGKIWSEIMELMLNSKYNKKTPFDFSWVKEYKRNENLEYGLAGDDFEKIQNALIKEDLILNPHDGDNFLLEENTKIILKAREKVFWFVDGEILEGENSVFVPKREGYFEILAKSIKSGKEEKVKIFVTK
jgi:membrane carboxypeptidase/penicillin-binding protein PbpC